MTHSGSHLPGGGGKWAWTGAARRDRWAAALLGVGITLAAAVPPGAVAQACDTPEHQALDFWLGHWREATSPTGDRYRVIRLLNGCAVEERLLDGRDGTVLGIGLAAFDQVAGRWRQLWTARDGQVIAYAGGPLADGSFAMETGPDPTGEIRRFVYRDRTAERLVAEYLASNDGGVTWRRFWSGIYIRIPD